MPKGVYKHRKGFRHSEETKKRMSIASKGKPKSSEHKLALKVPKRKYDRKPLSEEHKRKLSITHSGKRNYWFGKKGKKSSNWKGENAKYTAKHVWIHRNYGQPETCELCQKTGLRGRKIHWANKSHKYKRNINDWIRLCAKCHGLFDKIKNYRKHKKII